MAGGEGFNLENARASLKILRSLRDDLASHYREDTRVNDVYIAAAGTVMIDCRN